MRTELRPNIDWVGYVDWTVRDFHGYQTNRGSTYNAYLIRDQKTALIDAVKQPFSKTFLSRIGKMTELSAIDYVVCNHAEPDHSGALPVVMQACPHAELICNSKCQEALSKHFDTSGWNFGIVEDGESISLGKNTLTFINTPMVHWPESMFTYLPEEKLLFSMDAFGQHFASANRFDDEEPLDVIMAEAKTYYANIVMPYGSMVSKTLEKAAGLKIETIAPSHGVIWRKNIDRILSSYRDWAACKPTPKVLIIYESMWNSTEQMAQAILDGTLEYNVESKLFNVRTSNNTMLATEILDAATIAVGSSTLNSSILPLVAGTLTYFKGLKPSGKAGFAFGSYGWNKAGAKEAEEYLKQMKCDIIREPLQSQYVPSPEILKECRQGGKLLAEKALALCRPD